MPRVQRVILVLTLAAGSLLIATPRAFAVTVDQIVELTRAGVSEPVILALIDRDRTIFTIEADQIVTLKREGVSETVLIAMLKSGRADAEAAMRAESAANDARMLAALAAAPELVIVGHGPEIPNAPQRYNPAYYESAPGVITLPAPMPYVSPYAPPALLIESAPCLPRRGWQTSCATPFRRGRSIR